MNPQKDQTPEHDGAYAAWGCMIGAVAGVIVGLIFGHWVAWAFLLGVAGLSVGAVIDRSKHRH